MKSAFATHFSCNTGHLQRTDNTAEVSTFSRITGTTHMLRVELQLNQWSSFEIESWHCSSSSMSIIHRVTFTIEHSKTLHGERCLDARTS